MEASIDVQKGETEEQFIDKASLATLSYQRMLRFSLHLIGNSEQHQRKSPIPQKMQILPGRTDDSQSNGSSFDGPFYHFSPDAKQGSYIEEIEVAAAVGEDEGNTGKRGYYLQLAQNTQDSCKETVALSIGNDIPACSTLMAGLQGTLTPMGEESFEQLSSSTSESD